MRNVRAWLRLRFSRKLYYARHREAIGPDGLQAAATYPGRTVTGILRRCPECACYLFRWREQCFNCGAAVEPIAVDESWRDRKAG